MRAAPTSRARKSGGRSGRAVADPEYQQLTSDIFHDLSQPLTTLVCLLEVNLLLSRPAKQVRHDLQIALKQANSIVRFDRALRELWESGNTPEHEQVLSLTACLREVVADLLPVAESANVKLSLTSSRDSLVNFHAGRLRQAVFYLLEFALGSAAVGAEVKVAASEEEESVRITVAISEAVSFASKARTVENNADSAEQKQREWKRRMGPAIARRIIESGDGTLQTESSGKRLWLEVRLPSASCPK